jgi:hypothetical protein
VVGQVKLVLMLMHQQTLVKAVMERPHPFRGLLLLMPVVAVLP